jgi:putative MATE family efflux protein
MTIWYWGVGFLVIPMLGNSAIRATGDTRTPAMIMMTAGLVNVVLDPLLIFGIGPFPRLELRGAALATVISWVVSFVAAFWILARRERMLLVAGSILNGMRASWAAILHVGLPAAATNVLVPLAAGVLTRLVAQHGTVAVAAFGVGTRVESLALVAFMALSAAITPLAGQNFGAGKTGRVRQALGYGVKVCLIYGLSVAALLAVLAPPLAGLFNKEPAVLALVISYLRILPVSYGLLGAVLLAAAIFNAVSKPLLAAVLNLVRLFVLVVPLAYLGSSLSGVLGIFWAMSAANLLAGAFALLVFVFSFSRFAVGEPAPVTAEGAEV